MGSIMRNSLLGLLLLFCGGVCQGQVDEQRAKAIAETATRTAANYSQSHLLRAHRREDIEDDLFRFQIKVQGKIAKAAYFYEVSGEGHFVVSPSEAVFVTSEDGHLIRIVAVSTKSGEAYLLSGFKNAAVEFNRLAKDAALSISSNNDAQQYARFYFTVVADPSAARLMLSSRQLKHRIEDYFFSNYDEKKAEGLFKQWWSGFLSERLPFQFEASTSLNSLGYEATLATVSGSTKRTPLLDLWILQIAPDGPCEVKTIRTVYPSTRQS